MANIDTGNIDISLLSDDDLQNAARLGIMGARIGLPIESLPTAQQIAQGEFTFDHPITEEWAEQYRNVVIHCYQSSEAAQQENPLRDLLTSLLGSASDETPLPASA